MQEHGYVTRGKTFEDDSSSSLGLRHDSRGRRLVTLPRSDTGYDPALVGRSPDDMAALIADREHDGDERDGNDIERLMKQYPGGKHGSHSSSGSKRPKRPRPPSDHTKANIVDLEAPAKYRPHVLAGRVSTSARHGLLSTGVSVGEMLDRLGETLHLGVSWTQVEFLLIELAQQQRIA